MRAQQKHQFYNVCMGKSLMLSLLEYIAYECELLCILWSVAKKKGISQHGSSTRPLISLQPCAQGRSVLWDFYFFCKPCLIMKHELRLHWGMYPNGNFVQT